MSGTTERRRVIVAFPNTHISRVEKMSGIFQFLAGKNNWDIEMRQKPLKPTDLDKANGVLLTGVSSADSLPAIEASDIPAVLIAATCSRRRNVTIINTDAAEIGKQIAMQFLSRGIYKSYACLHSEIPSAFSHRLRFHRPAHGHLQPKSSGMAGPMPISVGASAK